VGIWLTAECRRVHRTEVQKIVAANKEGKVEQYLVSRVVEQGGLCLKWVSPGLNGVPDRIILLPETAVCFAEVKAADGALSKRQQTIIERIHMLEGAEVFVFSTKAEIDEFIEVWLGTHAEFMRHTNRIH